MTGRVYKRIPLEERFWPKVKKRGPDECWEWTGHRNIRSGHGQIGRGGRGEGVLGAHVVAYEIAYGPVPDGKFVCHHCDNPPCVNPKHLYAGTQQDNMRDARERSGLSVRLHRKVSCVDARDILLLFANGARYSEIAARYGISKAYVSRIVHPQGADF